MIIITDTNRVLQKVKFKVGFLGLIFIEMTDTNPFVFVSNKRVGF